MRKTLEDFYFGNITPSERQMTPDSALARAVGRAARCEMQLNEVYQISNSPSTSRFT